MRNGSHRFDLKNGACMKKCFNFLEDPRRRKGITLRKGWKDRTVDCNFIQINIRIQGPKLRDEIVPHHLP